MSAMIASEFGSTASLEMSRFHALSAGNTGHPPIVGPLDALVVPPLEVDPLPPVPMPVSVPDPVPALDPVPAPDPVPALDPVPAIDPAPAFDPVPTFDPVPALAP